MDESVKTEGQRTGPEGFGGWLILPVIGLVVIPISALYTIVRELRPFFFRRVLGGADHTRQRGLSSVMGTADYFRMPGQCRSGDFSADYPYVFKLRSRRAPGLYIAFIIVSLLITFVDTMLAASIPALAVQHSSGPARNFGYPLLSALIWIPYLLRSKRVKATFTQ